jgi:hypothetical protein
MQVGSGMHWRCTPVDGLYYSGTAAVYRGFAAVRTPEFNSAGDKGVLIRALFSFSLEDAERGGSRLRHTVS